jgi:hypothetical protein
MGNRSRRKARRDRKSRALQKAEKSIFTKPWGKIKPKLSVKRSIEIAITLIGVISAYIGILGYWLPRISVQPLSSFDSKDSAATIFSVSNQGSTTLYDVQIGHRIRKPQFDLEGAPIKMLADFNVYDSIPPMKSATVDFGFKGLYSREMDIDIFVWYRPAWYPFKHRESFRFVTRVSDDGQVQWLPSPESNEEDIPPPPTLR